MVPSTVSFSINVMYNDYVRYVYVEYLLFLYGEYNRIQLGKDQVTSDIFDRLKLDSVTVLPFNNNLDSHSEVNPVKCQKTCGSSFPNISYSDSDLKAEKLTKTKTRYINNVIRISVKFPLICYLTSVDVVAAVDIKFNQYFNGIRI